MNGHGLAEPSCMKKRTEGHTVKTISGDTRAHWSDGFALVPSLEVAYAWHASKFTLEVRDGLPRISEALATWCVENRVKLLGVEPPSVADVNNKPEVTLIHKTLLGGRVTIVEGLTNLDQLTGPKVFFAALPLRIAAGDGCPCRAFAVDGADAVEPLTRLLT